MFAGTSINTGGPSGKIAITVPPHYYYNYYYTVFHKIGTPL